MAQFYFNTLILMNIINYIVIIIYIYDFIYKVTAFPLILKTLLCEILALKARFEVGGQFSANPPTKEESLF